MSAFIEPVAPMRGRTTSGRFKSILTALHREFDAPFRLYDGSSGELIWPSASGESACPTGSEQAAAIRAIAAGGRSRIDPSSHCRYRIALPLRQGDEPDLVAVGHIAALARLGRQTRTERARLRKWADAVQVRLSDGGPPSRLGEGKAPPHDRPRLHRPELARRLVEAADGTCEAIEQILHRAAAVVPAEALAWIPSMPGGRCVAWGRPDRPAADSSKLALILSDNRHRGNHSACIFNRGRTSPLGRWFPEAENLMVLSAGGPTPHGWLIIINKRSQGRRERHRPWARSVRPGSLTSGRPPAPARPVIAPFLRSDANRLMPFVALLDLRSGADRRGAWAREIYIGVTRSLTVAIDAKDSYTYGHSERVARIAVELGRTLGLGVETLDDLYLGGLLHDIGKIGVRDAVLSKAGPLTPEEHSEIREHVIIGTRILADCRSASHLLPMILYHHERFDGAGYPHGLEGEDIPLTARILAVADSYDAMRTSRVYRSSLPLCQIEEILERGRDGQWDGKVIDAFARARSSIAAIYDQEEGDADCLAFGGALRVAALAAKAAARPVVRRRAGPADPADFSGLGLSTT